MHINLKTGSQETLLDYMRQQKQAGAAKLCSYIDHLCDRLSQEDDDPEEDDWW